MIHDQSCHNLIGIESKMQGDHEEFKILLENCLISSRLNQQLGLQRKNMAFFIENFIAKIADRTIR